MIFVAGLLAPATACNPSYSFQSHTCAPRYLFLAHIHKYRALVIHSLHSVNVYISSAIEATHTASHVQQHVPLAILQIEQHCNVPVYFSALSTTETHTFTPQCILSPMS